MRKLPKLLSKTKIMRGYRCLKAIYYTIHHPELEAEITEAQQKLFDQGNEVGEKARAYYPGGTLVDCKPWEFVDALRRTRELLKAGTEHIFEAAFEYKGCYARADILKYNPATQRWTLLEVKAATKVKPEHLDDVGLQAWIIANSGLKLEKICLVHLNSECRYPNLENLFVEVDVTDRLREGYPNVAPKLNSIFKAIRSETVPDIDLGPQCTANFRDCEFKESCWTQRQIPAISVFNLPKINEKAWDFYRHGQVNLMDVNPAQLDELQKRIVDCHATNERFVDASGIQKALASWQFPLVFLDFETINSAIPRFNGCSPYQQVPFQFSVHIWPAPTADRLSHSEFLNDAPIDPRPELIPQLIAACGQEGSVVSYYAKFERDCLQGMADAFEEYREPLLKIAARLVDPLEVIRAHVYDPGFNCSFSLKQVAPALVGMDYAYDHMEVQDGSAAQRAYELLIHEKSPEAREKNRQAMLDYCRQDTLAMVALVQWLFQNQKLEDDL